MQRILKFIPNGNIAEKLNGCGRPIIVLKFLIQENGGVLTISEREE